MAKRKRYRKKQTNTVVNWIIALVIIIWGGWFKLNSSNQVANQNQNQDNSQQVVKNATTADTNYGGLSSADYQKLANLDFKSGDKAYVYVNNNKSTLIKNAWKVNKVIYSNLDNLNRTSHSNTAFLEPRNVANDSLRVRQFINPTAWHSNRENGTQIYNRGHLIAYSVSAGIDQDGNYNPDNQSGDQNNPKNLFTQTAFSNQKIQTIFEGKVRNALKQGNKVIFQATPIFRGNELMARGINLQAISLNNNLDFNVYIYNVQPDYVFDYNNGRAKIDRNMVVNQ
ncbi:DNA/RNA non-specific endonuclease [Lactobacillus johnsonii]|jgi:DNA-entry nuclease|uniref:Putative DNA/RNA non-specific endonuclease n=1 Tax=Lactobacillus johnsonii ATCC 33200 TaxID=525330 RepID=C2E4P8_LACJH|nr:DNA/RNA non-specific endonuclease [Lactobacillus johnsonii]MBC9721526.1 DNA/RNA non-specific endonuclease [Lactobacillus sp.]AXQ20256.1 DNA/RNA non-specific endonuclease [Lactobacillus johnsonii]EEJ60273.1 putative DNA/RNA non-specific endonuclease [Lactobacillus johnsonii ATCC 33200]KAB1958475.1 DNA/RNA non-specific endonuclease [Lactobacillus johnsonii]KRK54758.1 DNA-entry nuclease [Lactobacillus johnsonii ATCC 33200]